jgi:hypothetical protein
LIFFKKFQDFIIDCIIAKLKNQNGGLLCEMKNKKCFWHHLGLCRHFDCTALQQCFYFYIALELQHIKK